MSRTLETIVNTHVPSLLGAIRNHPPGREYIFTWSKFKPNIGSGFGVHWWVADDQPFYDFIFELTELEPTLLDRYSLDEAVKSLTDVIQENLNDFDLTPFLGLREHRMSLIECASPAGLEAVASEILGLVNTSGRAVLLFPVRGLRPESDIAAEDLIWITPSAPRQLVESLRQISDPRLTFDRFPPFIDSAGVPLKPEDSMLGLIANGLEGGSRALQRLAGALCLSLPYRDAALKSADTPIGATAVLFCDGRIEIRELGPFLPRLMRPKVLPKELIDRMRGFLKPRSTPKRDNRFRVALQFLSLGWILTGDQSFMNWFIAIDALFGKKGGWEKAIKNGVDNRLSALNARSGDRIDLLMDIRHDLLHGRCSSVSSSEKYLPYRKRFKNDPLKDIFVILRECLILEP